MPTTFKKPTLPTADVRAFAEGASGAKTRATKGKGASRSENAPTGQKSGLVPDGDVRLTANIREDLHIKLKVKAAQERMTIGALIEQWIEGWR